MKLDFIVLLTQSACLLGEHLSSWFSSGSLNCDLKTLFPAEYTLITLVRNTPACQLSACVHSRWINSWIRGTSSLLWRIITSPIMSLPVNLYWGNTGCSRRSSINKRHLDKKKSCYVCSPGEIESSRHKETRDIQTPVETDATNPYCRHLYWLYSCLCEDPWRHNVNIQP